jgi:N-sulfoglucosamine sulfohydrolase
MRVFIAIVSTWAAAVLALTPNASADPARPNILWITCEDISPHVGCFGDDYAVTPNIDALAKQGVKYINAFAPIGVCAPARSSLIFGMYAPSVGSQHMRCKGTPPDFIRGYAEYLRKAGYYCTNNSKTDYNWNQPKSTWDESSKKAHWRNRPDKDQPFFAIFNDVICHESQIRIGEAAYQARMKKYGITPHDHAKAPVPPYHPDTPETRQDWARLADMITAMDIDTGKLLKELDEDGLADNTIVFFYSDHGSGMPRSKRWLYDSSMRVPLVIRFPEKWRKLCPEGGAPGSQTDRLVNFVDLGPTALSLAGVKPPGHMQGHPFLGKYATEPPRYTYGFRDRMDERYDLLRCVVDKRFRYIRNYLPHKPWFGPSQYISYMYQMPTMRVWQQLHDAGKLSPVQDKWFSPKPTEELYDWQADPYEIHNLAGDPKYQDDLKRLRAECRRWQKEIIDLGMMPEGDMRSRYGDTPQYEAVRKDPSSYPLDKILDAADLADERDPANVSKLIGLLARKNDPAVRWWGAVGLMALGKDADRGRALDALREAVHEPSGDVRVTAAMAMANVGHVDEALPVLIRGIEDDNPWVRLRAANYLDALDDKAAPAKAAMQKALKDSNSYVGRVVEKALADLKN